MFVAMARARGGSFSRTKRDGMFEVELRRETGGDDASISILNEERGRESRKGEMKLMY